MFYVKMTHQNQQRIKDSGKAFDIGGKTEIATGYYKEVVKDMIALAKERNIDKIYLLP